MCNRPPETTAGELARPLQLHERLLQLVGRCVEDIHLPRSTIMTATSLHLARAAVGLLDRMEELVAGSIQHIVSVCHVDLLTQHCSHLLDQISLLLDLDRW